MNYGKHFVLSCCVSIVQDAVTHTLFYVDTADNWRIFTLIFEGNT